MIPLMEKAQPLSLYPTSSYTAMRAGVFQESHKRRHVYRCNLYPKGWSFQLKKQEINFQLNAIFLKIIPN